MAIIKKTFNNIVQNGISCIIQSYTVEATGGITILEHRKLNPGSIEVTLELEDCLAGVFTLSVDCREPIGDGLYKDPCGNVYEGSCGPCVSCDEDPLYDCGFQDIEWIWNPPCSYCDEQCPSCFSVDDCGNCVHNCLPGQLPNPNEPGCPCRDICDCNIQTCPPETLCEEQINEYIFGINGAENGNNGGNGSGETNGCNLYVGSPGDCYTEIMEAGTITTLAPGQPPNPSIINYAIIIDPITSIDIDALYSYGINCFKDAANPGEAYFQIGDLIIDGYYIDDFEKPGSTKISIGFHPDGVVCDNSIFITPGVHPGNWISFCCGSNVIEGDCELPVIPEGNIINDTSGIVRQIQLDATTELTRVAIFANEKKQLNTGNFKIDDTKFPVNETNIVFDPLNPSVLTFETDLSTPIENAPPLGSTPFTNTLVCHEQEDCSFTPICLCTPCDGVIIEGECYEECDCENPQCEDNFGDSCQYHNIADACACVPCETEFNFNIQECCPPETPIYNESTGECVECQNNEDCPLCFVCVDGNCVPLECPEGMICDPSTGNCVEICDCNNPDCDPGQLCNPIPGLIDTCGCYNINCPDDCDSNCPETTDCGCLEEDCIPCNTVPCNTNEDCPFGCICEDGTCADNPCIQYDCDTPECEQAPGCICQGDDCTPCETLDCITIVRLQDEGNSLNAAEITFEGGCANALEFTVNDPLGTGSWDINISGAANGWVEIENTSNFTVNGTQVFINAENLDITGFLLRYTTGSCFRKAIRFSYNPFLTCQQGIVAGWEIQPGVGAPSCLQKYRAICNLATSFTWDIIGDNIGSVVLYHVDNDVAWVCFENYCPINDGNDPYCNTDLTLDARIQVTATLNNDPECQTQETEELPYCCGCLDPCQDFDGGFNCEIENEYISGSEYRLDVAFNWQIADYLLGCTPPFTTGIPGELYEGYLPFEVPPAQIPGENNGTFPQNPQICDGCGWSYNDDVELISYNGFNIHVNIIGDNPQLCFNGYVVGGSPTECDFCCCINLENPCQYPDLNFNFEQDCDNKTGTFTWNNIGEISTIELITPSDTINILGNQYELPIIDVENGDYTLIATLEDNCIVSETINVLVEPCPCDLVSSVQVLCTEVPENYTYSFSASGGTLPYTYFVNGVESPSSGFVDYGTGSITFKVIDYFGCEDVTNINLPNCPAGPNECNLSIDLIYNCEGSYFQIILAGDDTVPYVITLVDYPIGYDGTLPQNGNELPNGIYHFVIQIENCDPYDVYLNVLCPDLRTCDNTDFNITIS